MTHLTKGTGLRLVPLAEVSSEDIAREINDFEVSRWLTHAPYPYHLADAEAFREANLDDPEVRAIVGGDGFAGVVGTKRQLGYWLGRSHWGKGYGPEAARRMTALHFVSTGSDLLTSGYLDGNERSSKLLSRMGFQPDGEDRLVPKALGKETVLHKLMLRRDAFWRGLGMPIRTERLALRPMGIEDAAALTRIVRHPDVARMLFIFHEKWDEADTFIRKWAYHGGLRFRLAIEVNGRFAGTIGVGDGAAPPIFYFLDPAFAGRGIASEAVAALSSFVLKTFDVAALTAEVFTDNPASSHILQKCGFVETGRGMRQSAARLEPAPVVLYRL